MKPILKTIAWIALVLLFAFLCSCTKEPARWENTYIHVYPDDLQTLYVKYGNGDYAPQRNGENFAVELIITNGRYRLAVESLHSDFHYVWFNGLETKGRTDISLPLEWKLPHRSFVSEGPLHQAYYDFYEISLSKDKSK